MGRQRMKVSRRDSAEWLRLRRHKATFVASVAVCLESLCLVVALLMLTDHGSVLVQGAPVFWVRAVPHTF